MEFISKAQAKRLTGISYLGSVNLTSKHLKAYKFNEMTYSLYLAPASLSGYNVCSNSTQECRDLCLNKSGKNIGEMNNNLIDRSRIKKTQLFMENKEFFMDWLVQEIKDAQAKAKKLGYSFSVRLNNTSDLSPLVFRNKDKKNILQIFPDVQFYEYTKVPNRYKLMDNYPNYDVTFSYSGENESICKEMLKKGIRVAVVFRKKLPTEFWGRPVVDGDKYDMRYKDPKGCIVGLKFKTVKNKIPENSKFVVTI